jgi:hypothetical protein
MAAPGAAKFREETSKKHDGITTVLQRNMAGRSRHYKG